MRIVREFGAKTTVVDLMQVNGIVSLLTERCVPFMTAMTGDVRRNDNPPFPTHARFDY